ncbi:hypothetical protein, partial [Demequina sp.]|uniref:hypothetical protein n=1 Tax=Demequina sp. TaxID=2050685 RepID=UPI0025ECC6A7
EFSGVIAALDNGCLMLDRGDGTKPWIVWPPDAEPGAAGGAQVGGELYAVGDAVSGTGTLAVLADLPGGADDNSYFGLMGKYCDGDAAGVAVLDSIVRAAA